MRPCPHGITLVLKKAFGAFQACVVWITNPRRVLQCSVIRVEVIKFESQLRPLQCGWFCSVASELVYPVFWNGSVCMCVWGEGSCYWVFNEAIQTHFKQWCGKHPVSGQSTTQPLSRPSTVRYALTIGTHYLISFGSTLTVPAKICRRERQDPLTLPRGLAKTGGDWYQGPHCFL